MNRLGAHLMIFAMAFAWVASPGDGWAVERLTVYKVDLRKAVLQLPRGREVKATLERMRRAEEAQVRRMEGALVKEKATLSQAEYRRRFEKIQTRIDAAARRLDDEQAKLLDPILNDLRAVIAKAQKSGLVVLDISAELPLRLDPTCDRTRELVKAVTSKRTGAAALGKATKACRFDGLLFVQYDRVVKTLPESQAAIARLDSLQKQRQKELEAQKKRLVEIERMAKTSADARWREEAAYRARQLDEAFRRYQKEIREAEFKSQNALYGRVERALVEFQKKRPAILFVEYFDERPARDRSCEVTEWASALVKGQRPNLKIACAWVR